MEHKRINHLRWTSAPLNEDVQVMGFPVVSLWVSSSTTDANIFTYLQAVDVGTQKGAYVTEGIFRVSNRKELKKEYISSPANEDMRYLPGG